MQINIYTDGALRYSRGQSTGAAGRRSWWRRTANGKSVKETVISGGAEMTTNNRMELKAAIEGLRLLRQPAEISVYSDSRYVIDIASGKKRARTNADLWRELRASAAGHDIRWRHIAGHSGHVYNERCDKLAVAEKNKLARPAAEEAARESEVQIYLSTRYAAAKRLSVWAAVIVQGERIDELSGRFPSARRNRKRRFSRREHASSQSRPNAGVTLFTAQDYLSKGMTAVDAKLDGERLEDAGWQAGQNIKSIGRRW